MAFTCSAKLYLASGITLTIITMLLLPIAIFLPSYINHSFDDAIRKSVLITEAASKDPNNVVYRAWRNSTAEGATPTRLYAYFFNITNTHEVLEGAKPHVEEFGPYVYTISKQKGKVEFGEDTFGERIVNYVEWKEYIFERQDSIGPETDMYTSTNLIFHYWRARDIFGTELPKRFGSDDWNDHSRLFLAKSVRQWLFGWQDDNFDQDNGYFRGLIGKPVHGESEVVTGTNSMYTGETRIANAFHQSQRDGIKGYVPSLFLKTAPMWANFDASRIVGSDGTRFSPFLNSSIPLQVFVDEAKRGLPLHFTAKVNYRGLELYEYRISKETMEPNLLWSTYKRGCFNMTQQVVMPMILTKPHFLDADESLSSKIDGLKPDFAKHDTVLGVHSITGVVMRASKSLQPSVNTIGPIAIPQQSTTWFPKMLPETYQPIAYMSERGSIEPSDAKKLSGKISTVQTLNNFASWGILIISAIFLSATAFLLYKAYQTKVASFVSFNSAAYGDYLNVQE